MLSCPNLPGDCPLAVLKSYKKNEKNYTFPMHFYHKKYTFPRNFNQKTYTFPIKSAYHNNRNCIGYTDGTWRHFFFAKSLQLSDIIFIFAHKRYKTI